jgi:hypothetical protein
MVLVMDEQNLAPDEGPRGGISLSAWIFHCALATCLVGLGVIVSLREGGGMFAGVLPALCRGGIAIELVLSSIAALFFHFKGGSYQRGIPSIVAIHLICIASALFALWAALEIG